MESEAWLHAASTLGDKQKRGKKWSSGRESREQVTRWQQAIAAMEAQGRRKTSPPIATNPKPQTFQGLPQQKHCRHRFKARGVRQARISCTVFMFFVAANFLMLSGQTKSFRIFAFKSRRLLLSSPLVKKRRLAKPSWSPRVILLGSRSILGKRKNFLQHRPPPSVPFSANLRTWIVGFPHPALTERGKSTGQGCGRPQRQGGQTYPGGEEEGKG